MNEKKTIVIKIGTSSLTTANGSLSEEKVENIVRQVAQLRDDGHRAIIVTSGSIAAGFRRLGYKQRPKSIARKQAAAAVGQGLLMEVYTKHLLSYGYVSAQILLTRGDFTDKRRYTNTFNAIQELLNSGAVPIINENDTISIEELCFGDNDKLSAQVAAMIHADLLIILTDVDGLYTSNPKKDANAEHIAYVEKITPELEALAGEAASELSTGGMSSKIAAASLASITGVPVFICSSADADSVLLALKQEIKGTYFAADPENMKTKLQWMAFYTEGKGRIYIDLGATDAIENQGKSLLPLGIIAIEGDFSEGDAVDVYSYAKEFLGRGICNYNKSELMMLKEDKELSHNKVAIHRNNWIGSKWIRLFHD